MLSNPSNTRHLNMIMESDGVAADSKSISVVAATTKKKRSATTSATTTNKKRKKEAAPMNYMKETTIYPMEQASEVIAALKRGDEEAVIIDASFLSESFNGDTMVKYWNARVKEEYRVPAPTSPAYLIANLQDYTGLPGITGGMWHAYATTAHDSALDSPTIDHIFTEITGTSDWQIHPNRMRLNLKNNDDGWKQTHLEGEHVMKATSNIGCIVCLSAGRTFTYYAGSNNDSDAQSLYRDNGGPKSRFIKLKPNQLTKWQRTTITTTKPGQMILFAGSVIHEISRLSPSLSLFLSPFNPAEDMDGTDFYKGIKYEPLASPPTTIEAFKTDLKVLKKARAQAKKLKTATIGAPVFPLRLRLPGKIRQDPKEFAGLTRKETDIFGSLFHSPGTVWPAGKETFPMFHMMAFNTFAPKLLPFMFIEAFDVDTNKQSDTFKQVTLQRKFNYEVITRELVAGCDEFDMTYFDNLPFQNITPKEVESMKIKYNGIPSIAWCSIQYWVKDIRKCSVNVAKRRGYIVV